MANSNIEWTEKVWNPVVGCNKVSPGCKNCYAEKMHKRLRAMGQEKYQREFLDGAFPWEEDLLIPFHIKKPTVFFVNSMSDLFHDMVPVEYIVKVFAVMALCPQHTFQVLTKRDVRMWNVLANPGFRLKFEEETFNLWRQIKSAETKRSFILSREDEFPSYKYPLPNVWLGVSTENQEQAEQRINNLLLTPAAVRMVSMEPMLEEIDLDLVDGARTLDWIIVGGESGPKRRPFVTDWARKIRDWCKLYEVPFFMKQIDKVRPIPSTLEIKQYPRQRTI